MLIRYSCPSCGGLFFFDEERPGESAVCQACHQRFTIPGIPQEKSNGGGPRSKQQKIIWAGIICLGFLSVFVPWKRSWDRRVGDFANRGEAPAGYAFIFSPPMKKSAATVPEKGKEFVEDEVSVDLARMIPPMIMVVVVTAAGAYFAKEKSNIPA